MAVGMRGLLFAVVVGAAAAALYVRVLNVGENGNSSATTAIEVAGGAELTGKVAIVTGAGTGGIGFETARVLALHGAHVFVHGRSEDRVAETVDALRADEDLAGLETAPQLSSLVGDLSSLQQVRAMAQSFLDTGLPLHLLVLNAGIMAVPDRRVTQDGIELQMGINHVAHTLLASLLVEPLRAGAPSRVVAVSSSAHRFANLTFVNNAQLEVDDYTPFGAYGNSKAANVMFAAEFQRRYSKDGITAVSLHPGIIFTNLSRHIQGIPWQMLPAMPYWLLARKSIPQGAATSVHCAVSDEIPALGGRYFEDAHVSDVVSSHTSVFDADVTAQLWDKTFQLIKNVEE